VNEKCGQEWGLMERESARGDQSEEKENDTRTKRQALESDARIDMLVSMEERRGRNDV
jgi:hypothetical protein